MRKQIKVATVRDILYCQISLHMSDDANAQLYVVKILAKWSKI